MNLPLGRNRLEKVEIPLAKSPEQNQCEKIYSHHGAKLDENRTSTLTNSTIMHSVESICRLVVISPTDPPRAGAHHHRKKMWGLILGEGSSGPLPPQAIARRSKDSG